MRSTVSFFADSEAPLVWARVAPAKTSNRVMARQQINGLRVMVRKGIRSLLHGKFVDCDGMKFLARRERRCWKIRMIRRIRKVLCFQAHCRTTFVSFAPFTVRGSIQKIACIDLDTRLSRPSFDDAAARWV